MIGQECLRTHERNALACTPRVLSPLWWEWVRGSSALRRQKQVPFPLIIGGGWMWAMNQHTISITRQIQSWGRTEHSPASWASASFHREKLCPGWHIILKQLKVGGGSFSWSLLGLACIEREILKTLKQCLFLKYTETLFF